MTNNSSASASPDRLLPMIGGAASVLVGFLQAYFLYQTFALILQYGIYDLLVSNLLVMSAQLVGMVMSIVGGMAVLARLHWGWPLAVGAAGFQLAMFAQLTAMYGVKAMTAIFDQAAYVQIASLSLCVALIVLLSLRASTRALQVRAPHVLAGLAIAASLLLVWNLIQQAIF
jgi:hypothetical protein